MLECVKCFPPRKYKNTASLRHHNRSFHGAGLNTIAIVDPNRKHPLSNGHDIRKRNLSKILDSTSGESSDSDSTMDSSDDEVQTKKPKWIKLSEDDKARIRKHNQSSIDSDSTMGSDSSDDEADTKKPRRVKLPDNNKACSCKRKHCPDSSDEEPENKIQRRGEIR